MQGSFSLGVLEVFVYLLPGAVLLATAIGTRVLPSFEWRFENLGHQVAFLGASYLAGHLLTLLSLPVAWLRSAAKIRRSSRREARHKNWYNEFHQRFEKHFGFAPDNREEYVFSLRLVAEHLPRTNATVDRLFALTLFSRNLVVAFAISALITRAHGDHLPWIFTALAALFFVRYVHLERATSDTVLRAAFIHLLEGGAVPASEDPDLPRPPAAVAEGARSQPAGPQPDTK